jgi:hypothetical protein
MVLTKAFLVVIRPVETIGAAIMAPETVDTVIVVVDIVSVKILLIEAPFACIFAVERYIIFVDVPIIDNVRSDPVER